MHLYFSDLHLGRGGAAAARASERALVACLRAHETEVTGLSLVGDVFEAYIEYKTLIPKGFTRFLGVLAEWADRGIPITYLAGNHDPWHRDYFKQEFGARVVMDGCLEEHEGRRVFMIHGDGLTPDSTWYRRAKPILRHPLPVWLYRTLLPGDSGLRLAHWVNEHFGHGDLDPDLIENLETYAREMLSRHGADLVVMGHSHHHQLEVGPEGCYLNTGYWHGNDTFARLTEHNLTLCRWKEGTAEVLGHHAWPSVDPANVSP